MTLLIALLSVLASAAEITPPQHAVVRIEGMDCAGCQAGIARALEAVGPVGTATVVFNEGAACVSLEGPVQTDALAAAVTEAGHKVSAVEAVDSCPPELRPGHRGDPWAGAGNLDVKRISDGATVKLEDHLVAGKFTIVDFGAPWCGPCFTSATTIAEYMDDKSDVAVRVVHLDAKDPKASFALPVAKQHLAFAAGLPWFIVFSPDGKKLYEGNEVAAALQTIDRKR